MARNQDILINILTRTSNRPNGFYKCYNSIKKQSYKNVRHIVAYDNKSDLIYLEGLVIDKIYVGEKYDSEELEKEDKDGNTQAIYNLYCNDLLYEVKEGWVLFLDDDNFLYHNKVLEEIVDIINFKTKNISILFWQMRYPNGVVLPSNLLMEKQSVKKYNIDSSCFMFHSKLKGTAKWDAYKVADYRFIKALQENKISVFFVKKVFIKVNNFGALGAKNDIDEYNKTLDYTFNKNFFWYFIPKSHFELFGVLIFQKITYIDFTKKANKFKRRLMNIINLKI